MSKPGDEYRDDLLAAALAELEVPEHEEGFFEELERLLAENEAPDDGPSQGPLPVRASFRPWPLRLGIAGVLAVILFVAIGLPRVRGPEKARAAELSERVREAVESVATLRGRIVYRTANARRGAKETLRFSFATTARGDFRLTQLGATGDLAYDAGSGRELSINTSASIGTGTFYAVRAGVAPGPPDQGPSDFIVERQLRATIRALLAVPDARVDEVDYRGRKSWRVILSVRPNVVFPDVDRLEVVVDQATAFPVEVVSSLRGSFRSELRIEDLTLDANLPPETFAIHFPRGAEVLRSDEGFRRVRLDEVAPAVGYRPLLPRRLPPGYKLVDVAVAKRSPATAAGVDPSSEMVVSLAYRHGFDRLVVTTRLREGPGTHWRDPFSEQGVPLHSDVLRFSHGALAGASAHLVVDPRTVPHIWALTDALVVTVAGDLTEAQLVDVAASLGRGG